MTYRNNLENLSVKLKEADAVLIGAGGGLSTSAGFNYAGERFERFFADFENRYGFHDMSTGSFYPFKTLEEKWAFLSRVVTVNRYMNPPKPVYDRLFNLVEDKDYFVLTTNLDHCFQKAGFDKKRLFYTQGDYGLFQCSVPCHFETYDNEKEIKEMYEKQYEMKIPSELIPICPKCKRPMRLNTRTDFSFVEDKGWKESASRYESFCRKTFYKKVLFLELGVGYITPGSIKYPFIRMAVKNPHSTYVCINFGEAECPPELEDRAICINSDIGATIDSLVELKRKYADG